mmetsp:Transcript_23580/g.49083  ORF Transcript_23580/g.49083 Transcript_23580/m.49083 type:complete len:221 (-) Transcript_23580:55-717(-)
MVTQELYRLQDDAQTDRLRWHPGVALRNLCGNYATGQEHARQRVPDLRVIEQVETQDPDGCCPTQSLPYMANENLGGEGHAGVAALVSKNGEKGSCKRACHPPESTGTKQKGSITTTCSNNSKSHCVSSHTDAKYRKPAAVVAHRAHDWHREERQQAFKRMQLSSLTCSCLHHEVRVPAGGAAGEARGPARVAEDPAPERGLQHPMRGAKDQVEEEDGHE